MSKKARPNPSSRYRDRSGTVRRYRPSRRKTAMEYAVKRRRWYPSNARSPIHLRARFSYPSETVRLWNTANAVDARMTRKASIAPPLRTIPLGRFSCGSLGFPVLIATGYGYTGADGVPLLQDFLDSRGNGCGQGEATTA